MLQRTGLRGGPPHPPAHYLLLLQALQCYQAALERNKDSKQLAEKVRVLQKIVQRQKRGGAAASNAGSSAAAS